MFSVLVDRTYRHLFLAQVISLLGTGFATVALGLLAYRLAGPDAGSVLGIALGIKMVAYVTLAPVAAALAERLPRRAFLVGLDLLRAAVVVFLPFVTEVWQVYALILLLQAASAGFTPAFQASIPDVLPDEGDYTKSLALSRLAEDAETLVSPLVAAALLTAVGFPVLFLGTAAGFLGSALLILSIRLPSRVAQPSSFRSATTLGLRIYMATPRLRGALALEFAVAAGGAMVLVNTVVLIRATFGLDDSAVALALASFGAGSILAALGLQRILSVLSDRSTMLLGAVLMLAGLATGPWLATFSALLPVWAVMGFGFSLSQMPIGRLLVRSAHPADRPALYAAQFALSHAGWLVAYPLAGWIGATYGLDAAFAAMTALGLGAFLVALVLWPADDPTLLDHRHDGLPADHPHWIEHRPMSGQDHRHAFVIDALHPRWPPAGRTNGLTGNHKN